MADSFTATFPVLSSEQRALLLDLGQITLDVAGIFDPTPIADLASAVVSLARGAWVPAAISAIAIVPFAGDLAKLTGTKRYVAILERAVRAARADPRFAAVLRPVVASLDDALARVPLGHVPNGVQQVVSRLRTIIADFLPAGSKAALEIARRTDEMLARVFGSSKNVGILPRQNMEVLVSFLKETNFKGGNVDEWVDVARAIDLHAAEKLVVQEVKAGTIVRQFVDPSKGADHVGQWLVVAEKGVHQSALGVAGNVRGERLFTTMRTVRVLKSRSAHTIDHWSDGVSKQASRIVWEKGNPVAKKGGHTLGGGVQYFLPEARTHLRPLGPKQREKGGAST